MPEPNATKMPDGVYVFDEPRSGIIWNVQRTHYRGIIVEGYYYNSCGTKCYLFQDQSYLESFLNCPLSVISGLVAEYIDL